MKTKPTFIRIFLCIFVFGILIGSGFVDTNQQPTGQSVPVGRYPAVSQETAPAVNVLPAEETLPADKALPTEEILPAEEPPAKKTPAPQSFLDTVKNVNDLLNSRVAWGVFMCLLLVGTGVYLSIRTGFLQFRKFGYIMRETVVKAFKRTKAADEGGSISPFQALCTAMAGTVGTGNIAGVTGAIVLGGPGAVFWMWIAALFGMLTKYAEIVLAVKFREKNAKGEWLGGPMYAIKNGMGKGWRWLGTLFAAFGALAAFGIGSMTQVNTIAGSIVTAVDSVTAASIAATPTEATLRLIVGIVIALLIGLVIIGGIKRMGAVTERIVPIMSLFYIVGSLIVIIAHADQLGMVFGSIFKGAFTPEAAFGGVGGFVLLNAVKRGVGRGVFSNEAGLGSAPIAHAATSETDPIKQGMYGVFEVFADTIVICTLTALAVLCSGVVPFGNADLAGAPTTISAFGTVLGPQVSSIFMAIAILFFAFSTILSWSLYGTRCFGYLTKERGLNVYRVLFLITIILGATMKLSLVWDIADTLNGFMAVPNLIVLLAMSGTVIKVTREHFADRTLPRE